MRQKKTCHGLFYGIESWAYHGLVYACENHPPAMEAINSCLMNPFPGKLCANSTAYKTLRVLRRWKMWAARPRLSSWSLGRDSHINRRNLSSRVFFVLAQPLPPLDAEEHPFLKRFCKCRFDIICAISMSYASKEDLPWSLLWNWKLGLPWPCLCVWKSSSCHGGHKQLFDESIFRQAVCQLHSLQNLTCLAPVENVSSEA